MANTYAVYNSGKMLIEYWCGDNYYEELSQHLIKQHSDDRVMCALYEVIDMRDANIQLSDEEIIAVSEQIMRSEPLKKVAMIINKQEWDKASLYSSKTWDLNVDVIAFHTLEAACAWIQFDRQHIDKKLKQLKAGLLVESEH